LEREDEPLTTWEKRGERFSDAINCVLRQAGFSKADLITTKLRVKNNGLLLDCALQLGHLDRVRRWRKEDQRIKGHLKTGKLSGGLAENSQLLRKANAEHQSENGIPFHDEIRVL